MVDFLMVNVGKYTIDGDSMGLIKFDQATASFGTFPVVSEDTDTVPIF